MQEIAEKILEEAPKLVYKDLPKEKEDPLAGRRRNTVRFIQNEIPMLGSIKANDQ